MLYYDITTVVVDYFFIDCRRSTLLNSTTVLTPSKLQRRTTLEIVDLFYIILFRYNRKYSYPNKGFPIESVKHLVS